MKTYIGFIKESKGELAYPYRLALSIAEEFCSKLGLPLITQIGPMTEGEQNKFYLVGSLRRRETIVGDIDLLITKDIKYSDISDIDGVQEIKSKGDTNIYFDYFSSNFNVRIGFNIFVLSQGTLPKELEVDSWKDIFGSMVLRLTGPQGYNIGLSIQAKKVGLKISQYGVFSRKNLNKPLPGSGVNEYSTYKALKIPPKYPQGKNWKAPELRGKNNPKSLNVFGAK